MKTSKVSRYFLVLLCVLGCNAAWGQKTVNVYFNTRQANGVPKISLSSNAPTGVEVTSSGFTWALEYYSSILGGYKQCSDRVVVKNSGTIPSTASISFSGFKYEVKQVQWNRMCDLLVETPKVKTAIISEEGNEITGKFEDNIISFSVQNYPGTNNDLRFNGLKGIVINDDIVSEYSRVFLKAGTGNNYAFKITYYVPSISLKKNIQTKIDLGTRPNISDYYTISHPGAFNFDTTYVSSNPDILTVDEKGIITPKKTGKAKITVTIKDGNVTDTKTKDIEVVSSTISYNQYLVTLNYNDGTSESEAVIATLNKDMPTVTAPIREGYIFRGYYEGKDYNQTEDWSKKYYNADGTSANKWDKNNNNTTLYAHWTAKTYTINFNTCGGKLSENVGIRTEGGEKFVETTDDQSRVSFDVLYGSRLGDRFWCGKPITIRPGYKFLGWFTKETGGDMVYSVGDNECSFSAVEGDFWSDYNTNGIWRKDLSDRTLNLYAQYECKFEIVDNGERINFKEGYDITIQDIDAAIREDNEVYNVAPLIVDVTKYHNDINPSSGSGDFVSSKGEHFYSAEQALNVALEEAREESKLAPNALVYVSKELSQNTQTKNVVMMQNKKCLNLVVTDRAPIKIPYAFKANNALYERNKNYSSDDAVVAQAANSKWGTLCLPYPIKNNSNNVKFYKLAGLKNNYMHFYPMEDAVIPANTPVLYKRMEGAGSDVKIEEAGVDVPMNTSYLTNPGSSYDSWQFIGTLTTKIFCGKDYDDKKVPAGAEKMNGSKEIYYFKQDQFTHLKNTGKVTMLPYRAYFTTTEANAKVAAFSLVAIDEEGATDITNLIDNDAEGDGKIYDLNGRRVMQPVSGRLYIVDGKKKVY